MGIRRGFGWGEVGLHRFRHTDRHVGFQAGLFVSMVIGSDLNDETSISGAFGGKVMAD